MNRISNVHRERNDDSRHRWDCFASHRRRVTKLLVAACAGGQGRLCVLGAGNCNDLDLSTLVEAYSKVHLVDLDESAVGGGIASQGKSSSDQIQVHGGIDLAGCNEITGDWVFGKSPADTELQRCVDKIATHVVPQLPGQFDVVASVCLLTQLFDSISLGLSEDHPRFLELLMCVRLRHLRLIFEQLRPGGTAILITDFVSSVTYPPLATTSEDDLPALASQLITARNFFTGTNPAALHSLFETDAVVAPQVCQLDVSRPWLWDFGPRAYAVCAITARTGASN
jgi:hypothetical protein